MPSVNNDSFTFSFQCLHFLSFSIFLELDKAACTLLNRNGDRGHSCLVPESRRKAFAVLLLNIICVSFHKLRYFYF